MDRSQKSGHCNCHRQRRGNKRNSVKYRETCQILRSSHSTSTGGRLQATAEDQRDRQYANHLNLYYDEVVTYIHDAETIQIFGPGEAKANSKNVSNEKIFPGTLMLLKLLTR